MPGPPPEVTTKRCRREGMVLAQLRQQLRQPPRVFVVAGHLHRRHGALELQLRRLARGDLHGFGRLLMAGSRLRGAGVFQQFQLMIGLLAPAKTRRAEEDHRVLNLLAPETRQRLQILGDNADGPPVGAVQERSVLISQRRGIERRRRAVLRNDGTRRGLRHRGLPGFLISDL